MTGTSATERVLRRLYRLLLRAYPSTFRHEYGVDMEETFLDRTRAARTRGVVTTLSFLLTAVADAATNGLRERFTPQPRSDMLYWQDVRYAFRLLRRSPVFTLLTVVVLSGGLALSIFTFSFLHTAMLKPLPLGGGDRIVRVSQSTAGSTSGLDAVDVAAMRSGITTLADVGAYMTHDVVIGDAGHRRVIGATAAEWNIFELTRTPPALGRGFRPDDQAPGAEPVVVLSHRTWEVVFAGDRAILDTVIDLSGSATRVVGVMPPGYGFPVASEAWIPLRAEVLAVREPGVHSVSLFARLTNNVNAARAEAELNVVFERARRARPVPSDSATTTAPRVVIRSFPMAQIGDEGPLMFTILNLIAALILLLACINVMNLLLARANERVRETAVRLALGASRTRLVMQSMWETILLCLIGGVLATALAAWGLDAINRWTHANLEGNLAFWWVWTLDRTALLSAGAFITLSIAVLGGVVAARVTSTTFTALLRDGGARSGSRREGRTARVLVVTQVATVSILMFFGVLSGFVARRVAKLEVGYDTQNLLSASVGLSRERFDTRDKRGALSTGLAAAMSASPAVDAVLLRAPVAAIGDAHAAFDLDAAPGASAPRAHVQAILGSLGTLGVVLRDGRAFDSRDVAQGAASAIVSEALARRYWPGASPIGRRLRLTGVDTQWRTVVGVASDVLLGTPFSRDRSPLGIYIPLLQSDADYADVVFRHRGDAAAAQSAFQAALKALDPLAVPPTVVTFDDVLAKMALIATSTAKLFGVCFAFALLLAVSGTYGLMARAIGQRTREIGVRRALGASDRSVLRLLLGQGSRQLGVGVVVAVPVMVVVGVGFWKFFPMGLAVPTVTGLLVSATIVCVVLLASYVPTRRVLRTALRDALWRD